MLLLFSRNFINNNQILLVPFDATDDAFQCLSESYSEICQISKMKRKNLKTESRELFRKKLHLRCLTELKKVRLLISC